MISGYVFYVLVILLFVALALWLIPMSDAMKKLFVVVAIVAVVFWVLLLLRMAL